MGNFLDKIKKDMKKGWAEGLAAVMQGANVVSVYVNGIMLLSLRDSPRLAWQS